MKFLLKIMAKETRKLKVQRETYLNNAKSDYEARKRSRPTLPRYLLATRIQLETNTFINIVNVNKVITEQELQLYTTNDLKHLEQCNMLIDIKKQLDA